MTGDGPDLVVVYTGEARTWGNVERAEAVLSDAGLSPVVLDEPDGTLLYVSCGTRKVRIAVPPDEAERAAGLLGEWDDSAEAVVEEQRSVLARDLALTFPLGFGAWLVAALAGGWRGITGAVAWGLGAWFAGFIIVSNIAGARGGDGSRRGPEADAEEQNE